MIALILSFFGSVILINKLVVEIKKTPIITITSNTVIPIGEVPFPAVTYCQELKLEARDLLYKIFTLYYFNNYTEAFEKVP